MWIISRLRNCREDLFGFPFINALWEEGDNFEDPPGITTIKSPEGCRHREGTETETACSFFQAADGRGG